MIVAQIQERESVGWKVGNTKTTYRERQKYEQGEKRIGKLTNIIFSNRKKKEQRKRKGGKRVEGEL
jgi:2-keto-4-pentenoate hydratase